MRGVKVVHFISTSPLWPLFGFVFQTLNHEVLQLSDTQICMLVQTLGTKIVLLHHQLFAFETTSWATNLHVENATTTLFLSKSPSSSLTTTCLLNHSSMTPLWFLCGITTYHAAKVATHKHVVERGQLQVGGPQVPGQLQTFAVRHTAAPVRRTQWTRTGRTFIWTHVNSNLKQFKLYTQLSQMNTYDPNS